MIALVSVRNADAPADARHRYGHEKLEDVAAGAQALLLLVGATFIGYEAIRRLINGGTVSRIGVGIVVAAVAKWAVNLVVSTYLSRVGRATGLEPHCTPTEPISAPTRWCRSASSCR